MLLVILAGTLYALAREPIYEYLTAIEIGSRLADGNQKPLEPRESVAAKLENSYIPDAVREYQRQLAADDSVVHPLRVEVDNPNRTGLVVLASRGPEELASYYIPLQKQVLNRLLNDHGRITSVTAAQLREDLTDAQVRLRELQDERNLSASLASTRLERTHAALRKASLDDPRVFGLEKKELENAVAAAEAHLESLEDQAKVIQRQVDQVERQEELLAGQVEATRNYVVEMQGRRPAAVDGEVSPANAMTVMLVDSDIQRSLARLAELEERLYVDLPNRLAQLEKDLADNRRQQADQDRAVAEAQAELERFLAEYERRKEGQAAEVERLDAEIEEALADREREIEVQESRVRELKVRLDNLRETRAVLPPQQSLKPVGPGRTLVLALSVLLGGMLGVLLAGAAALVRAVRERTE